MNPVLIGPSGCGRSHSEIPSRMLSIASVAMIDDSPSPRMRMTLVVPTASATPITASTPTTSCHPARSGVSTNEATTTHIVISAPTETSNARTISALV